MLPGKVEDKECDILVDTGSPYSLMSIETVKTLGLEGGLENGPTDGVTTVGGQTIHIVGYVRCKIQIGDYTGKHQVYVCHPSSLRNIVLVGSEFIKKLTEHRLFSIDYHRGLVSMDKKSFTYASHCQVNSIKALQYK